MVILISRKLGLQKDVTIGIDVTYKTVRTIEIGPSRHHNLVDVHLRIGHKHNHLCINYLEPIK
jgi:hypothetical protein